MSADVSDVNAVAVATVHRDHLLCCHCRLLLIMMPHADGDATANIGAVARSQQLASKQRTLVQQPHRPLDGQAQTHARNSMGSTRPPACSESTENFNIRTWLVNRLRWGQSGTLLQWSRVARYTCGFTVQIHVWYYSAGARQHRHPAKW